MIRYSYLPLETIVKDINIYDLTKLDWNKFQFKRGVRTYKLSEQDTQKFYNLMDREYGAIANEDWIYFVNKIDDPTALQVGQEIVLPAIEDIQDFISDQLGIKL